MEYDNARVLITDQKLETIKEVLPLLEQLTRINAPLLIIAEDVTGAATGLLNQILRDHMLLADGHEQTGAQKMAWHGLPLVFSKLYLLHTTPRSNGM